MRKNASFVLNRITAIGALIVAIFILSACGPVKIHSNPETFDLNYRPLPVLEGEHSIRLNNAYTSSQVVDVTPKGPNWVGDLQQYTDTAIVLLKEEFEKSNISISPDSEKEITVRVYDAEFEMGFWVIRCTLWLESELPDGKIVTVRGDNRSPATVYRAVDGAILRAVENLLQDSQFLEYFTSGNL
jgi:hypothetical protein